jgi:hypothetical protein
MRKFIYAGAAVVALVATSVAVAHGIEGAKSSKAVAATFSATGSNASSRTCTTTDSKTIVVTDGKYTGTAASGDSELAGAITLRARSVINTTDQVGTVAGTLRVNASGKDTLAAYSAVYDHGTIAGLAVGRAHQPNARLVANLSATFDAASGFTNGKIGGGTAAGSAIELAAGSCKPSPRPVPQKSEAHGTISALSTTSITVAGLTCSIPADRSAKINARFKANDAVEIRCSLVSGQNTLTKIEARHQKH